MKDSAIITLPVSPVKNDQYARFVMPIIGDTIGEATNSKFYMCVNALDSFKDRSSFVDDYAMKMKEYGVKFDELWLDKNHIDSMLERINKLIKLGYLYEKNCSIYRCDCGKIEIEQKNISTLNPEDSKKSFIIKDDKLICKYCNSECKLYNEKHLIFDTSRVKDYRVNILPTFFNKDIKTFENILSSSYLIVSRNRNTGIKLNYNGTDYNLDVDFLWQVFIDTFPEKNKTVLCGNKELYQLYLTGIFDKCLNNDSNTVLLATPIINKINDYDYASESLDDALTKKLAVIFNISWGLKNKNFDENILNKLKRTPYERKEQMWNAIVNGMYDDEEYIKTISNVLRRGFNQQEITKSLRKGMN